MKQENNLFPYRGWAFKVKRTPMILGLSAMLCMTAGVSYAGAAESAAAEVQSVQQERTVKGTVFDEFGEPLIGASVVVKGTTIGCITDLDGKFTLSVPSNQKQIEVSFIGYVTQVIAVSNGDIVVKLQPDTQALDEVVVIGYGTVKKRDLTGAVTSVKGDDITLSPGSRPMDALQGKIAGLDITKSSGQAGAGSSIQLRGTRSFQTDDSGNATGGGPTYIIDGMPGDINTLNPNDIESIEVLKDASSTAVYGSSGANGVIIVTTKGAKEGKATVNFNAYAGFTGWQTMPEMRTGDSFVQVRRDAVKATGATAGSIEELFSPEYAEAVKNNQWIDWVDEALNKGYQQNYSLSVSGGTEKTKAYFSLNFSDEQSLYKNDNYKVYSTRVRIDQEINKWITAGINVQASYTHKNNRNGVLEDAIRAIPLGVLYDEEGKMNLWPIPGDTSSQPNILADEQSGVYKNRSNNGQIYVNGYVEYKPLKGLSIKSQLGGAYSSSRSGKFTGYDSYNYLKDGGNEDAVKAEVSNSIAYSYKWENIVTYNTTLYDDHNITLTGVSTWDHSQNETYKQWGTGISDNKLLWYGLDGANVKKNLDNQYSMTKGLGFVARANYSYKGKYLFSASGRWDGSSRLADGNKWDFFPAVSAGWRISDEKFMEPAKNWLDNLKIRVGYGVSGSTSGISPYSSTSGIIESGTLLGGNLVPTTSYSQYFANTNLGWEKSYNTNIGLDASFLKNRINLTMDYYFTTTKDVIMTVDMPNSILGSYSSKEPFRMNANMGETKNKGIEIALNTRNIVNKDFTWTTDFTFAKNNEEITKLTEGQDRIIQAKNSDMVWQIGSPVYSYYGYKFDGIWQHSEAETAALFGCEPGDIKLAFPSVKHDDKGYYYLNDNNERVDITKDNPYTYRPEKDRQVLGHRTPDWTAGLKNTFTYKNFDLSVFMYARWGQTMKYDKVLGLFDPKGLKYNIPTYFSYYDTTLAQDQDVLFPAVNADKEFSDYDGYNSMYYVDGSFFKLKNVTLGYTLPKSLCNKVGISNLRVYGTITNLFVISSDEYVKDYDPEMGGGLDFPLSKELVFGVNLTF